MLATTFASFEADPADDANIRSIQSIVLATLGPVYAEEPWMRDVALCRTKLQGDPMTWRGPLWMLGSTVAIARHKRNEHLEPPATSKPNNSNNNKPKKRKAVAVSSRSRKGKRATTTTTAASKAVHPKEGEEATTKVRTRSQTNRHSHAHSSLSKDEDVKKDVSAAAASVTVAQSVEDEEEEKEDDDDDPTFLPGERTDSHFDAEWCRMWHEAEEKVGSNHQALRLEMRKRIREASAASAASAGTLKKIVHS